MKRLALLLALAACPATAQIVSGNELYSACNVQGDAGPDIQYGYCIGFITGAWEGTKIGVAIIPLMTNPDDTAAEIDAVSNQILGICLPDSVERGQVVAVMMKYLEENPASRHEPARSLLRLALMDAFPCQ